MTTIQIIWSTEDVLMQADLINVELTEEQADEILVNIEHYHDANVGINWDVISFHIDNYLDKQ